MSSGRVFRFTPAQEEKPNHLFVFLHGCGGLFSTTTGQIVSRELDWSRRLVDMGYAVLMVDSFSPLVSP